tara:strand:- start:123 stop:395 length:273 start_codon:yes stop_codon:yes gene_type:complete
MPHGKKRGDYVVKWIKIVIFVKNTIMKLKKTREFCQEYIDFKNRTQMGRPITDYSIKEVKDELHNAEMMIKVLYVCLILQTLICIILSTK